MNEIFLLFPVLFPVVFGALSALIPENRKRTRNIYTFALLAVCAASVWMLAFLPTGKLTLFEFTEKISFSLCLDGAGKIFSCLAATLWPLTALYAFEYMAHEENTKTFYAFFTMAFGATMGVAFASDIVTMYLFYELLTLFTIPLVMYGAGEKNIAAAKKYMVYSFGGAAFAFAAVMFLVLKDAAAFSLGGSLSLGMSEQTTALVLFLFAFFGFGVKGAIFPFHGWLPSASVAPTPVTALLHAVAVVKAGVFAIIRLIYFSYGTDVLSGTWAQAVAMLFAIITIFYGSSKAFKQTHFKKRMAYSTVANLSYIIFAATLMTDAGLLAALMHLVFHSVIKICLFFAVGAVLHHAHREYIRELDGIGKKMPVTFFCFTLAALSLVGIPPLCGFVSKWFIAEGALSHGSPLAIAGTVVLMISAFLTAMYAISVSVMAYFQGAETPFQNASEAGALMKIPMIICALSCVLIGIFSESFIEIITKAVGI